MHPHTQHGVVDLVRIINSYYSNLIEGNSTHPAEIELAMRKEYSRDPAKRNLQHESLAHIETQQAIEEEMKKDPGLDPSNFHFLCMIHKIFYSQLPDELHRVVNSETGERLGVTGGEIRTRDVKVGGHIPPEHDALKKFLEKFQEFYKRGRWHGVMPIVATAAAHHRLAWIHPFLDGNGRVTRLYTDACFHLQLPGYGIWNVSRGLARNRDQYLGVLAKADMPRRNDLDGRGVLSEEGLTAFCQFFLETCLDQVQYMSGLLQLDGLLERISGYVKFRENKMARVPERFDPSMKPEAARMLQEVMLRGEMPRGDVAAASGLKRAGRDILAQLVAEGILVSRMPKGPVRLAFPTHIAGYLFPELYPAQML